MRKRIFRYIQIFLIGVGFGLGVGLSFILWTSIAEPIKRHGLQTAKYIKQSTVYFLSKDFWKE